MDYFRKDLVLLQNRSKISNKLKICSSLCLNGRDIISRQFPIESYSIVQMKQYGFITHVDDNDRAETTTNSFRPHLDWLLN